MPDDTPKVEKEAEEKLSPEVTIEDAGPCKKRLNIKVAAERVTGEIDKAYKDLIETIAVPGFRKGHTPRSIAEKRFGKQITEEVRDRLASAAFVEAIDGKNFDTIGQPEFGEIKLEAGAPLAFEATINLKPTIEFEDYKGISLHKKSADVADKDIEERIELVRTNKAPLAPVDRPAQKDDQVTVDLKITSEGKELRSIEDARLFVSGESFLGLKVESVEKILAGKKAGEEFEFEQTLPDNFREEEYRNKAARIWVKVKEIKAQQLPEVNDEWARSLDFDDLDDMRDEIKNRLKREKANEVDVDLREQARNYLLEKANFDLPEGLIEKQAEGMFNRRRLELESQGVPKEEIEKRVEELRQGQKDATRKSFKLYFIMRHIADKEKIFVTEEEVDARIAAIAAMRGMPAAEVKTLYEQNEMMDDLRAEMREGKTLKHLIDNAKVAEEK
jgi:trigger factor